MMHECDDQRDVRNATSLTLVIIESHNTLNGRINQNTYINQFK